MYQNRYVGQLDYYNAMALEALDRLTTWRHALLRPLLDGADLGRAVRDAEDARWAAAPSASGAGPSGHAPGAPAGRARGRYDIVDSDDEGGWGAGWEGVGGGGAYGGGSEDGGDVSEDMDGLVMLGAGAEAGGYDSPGLDEDDAEQPGDEWQGMQWDTQAAGSDSEDEEGW